MAVTIPMKGATLQLTITGTPTAIPQVTTIDDIIGSERAAIDVTNINSTAVQTKKGMMNWGTFKFKIKRDPSDTTHQALESQTAGDDDSVILATLANTAASTIQLTGPLMKSMTKGGGPNDLFNTEYELKINSLVETA